ncbi:hypothetical protein L596_001302 [Steinernema carpocapsae]|uniref:Uncharacterized protein n=1 Tax=Steinernema carpocapsae TaxID=34508 RepID=A0A4U8UPX0_STECR|nr:hypothetical protein L596_001302 [Steinernema carpocapsae]
MCSLRSRDVIKNTLHKASRGSAVKGTQKLLKKSTKCTAFCLSLGCQKGRRTRGILAEFGHRFPCKTYTKRPFLRRVYVSQGIARDGSFVPRASFVVLRPSFIVLRLSFVVLGLLGFSSSWKQRSER